MLNLNCFNCFIFKELSLSTSHSGRLLNFFKRLFSSVKRLVSVLVPCPGFVCSVLRVAGETAQLINCPGHELETSIVY